MRRLAVLSILLVLAGLLLLLPSSALYSLITTGTTSSSSSAVVRFGVASTSSTDNTSTIESLVGFGLIGVGVVFEILSLITDVPGAVPTGTTAQPELAPPSPSTTAAPSVKEGEKKK